MIEVKIAGRRAVCTEAALLTSGSVGISIAFEFDGAWEGMSKAAVFIAGDTKIDVLLTENICLIPWEVLQEPGLDLIVGVYGTNGDTIVMPTVYTNVGRIRHGADFDGSEGTEPTPALVNQIMAAAGMAVETANSVREDADNGVFDGGSPTMGVSVHDEPGTPSKPQGGQRIAIQVVKPDGTVSLSSFAIWNGAKGSPGDPGYSPTVAVTDIEGGHRVTITDEDGDHVFDVLDGQGGGGGGVSAGLITDMQEILRAVAYYSADVSSLIAGLSQYAGQGGDAPSAGHPISVSYSGTTATVNNLKSLDVSYSGTTATIGA